MHAMGPVGRVSGAVVNPMVFLRTWNFSELPPEERSRFYRETARPDGTLLREYEIFAVDREIEIAPGMFFPAWTYNGQVPGPTIRATEGDRLRITFKNLGSHPHTMHFHGWHPPEMDGSLPGHEVEPGGTFVYEFDADPFGLHLYHCHAVPLKRHIHKGLYGTFIIDPRGGRPPADEMVMVMNAFDTNFDADNEVYAVNTVANAYMHDPIKVTVGRLVRIYLVNITEFDLVNSLHLHGMFFDVFRTGTALAPTERTDTVMLCQGERAIVETTFRYRGDFMFHAHQSEFAELGWMGLFRAEEARRDT
jgi:FtsP/CotA-like multicopper oxidase with cupredoxin domain